MPHARIFCATGNNVSRGNDYDKAVYDKVPKYSQVSIKRAARLTTVHRGQKCPFNSFSKTFLK